MTKRRKILLLALVAVAVGLGVLTSLALVSDNAQVHSALDAVASLPYASFGSVADEDVDKEGLVAFDPTRSWPGYTLYASESRSGAILLDSEGRVLWKLRDRREEPEHWKLVEPVGDGRFLALSEEESILMIDYRSQIEWEQSDLRFHHDVAVDEARGLIYALSRKARYESEIIWWKPVLDHSLVVMTMDGEIQRTISFGEVAIRHPEVLRAIQDRPHKAYLDGDDNAIHANTIEVLTRDVVAPDGRTLFREGQILTCWRNVGLIGVLDVESEALVWTWGIGELERPHHPSLLDTDRILVFDNGKFRGYSRLLEVDPATDEIVWEYVADPPSDFFSETRGSAERLPNGNTLVAESEKGRIFEIAPDGEIVWDYWDPDKQVGLLGGVERATIYRATRLPWEQVAFLEEARGMTPPGASEAVAEGTE